MGFRACFKGGFDIRRILADGEGRRQGRRCPDRGTEIRFSVQEDHNSTSQLWYEEKVAGVSDDQVSQGASYGEESRDPTVEDHQENR